MTTGTLPYMAPEQLEVGNADCSARIDLYSLGVVLFEMLTGRRPYRAHTPEALQNQIRTHRPSWDTMGQPAVPAELRLICDCCLSSDPKDRHASAQDLEAELRSYLSADAPANFAWSRFSPKIRPRLFLIGSLLALIAIAALFEAGRRTGLHQEQRSADRARSGGIQPPSGSELK